MFDKDKTDAKVILFECNFGVMKYLKKKKNKYVTNMTKYPNIKNCK